MFAVQVKTRLEANIMMNVTRVEVKKEYTVTKCL